MRVIIGLFAIMALLAQGARAEDASNAKKTCMVWGEMIFNMINVLGPVVENEVVVLPEEKYEKAKNDVAHKKQPRKSVRNVPEKPAIEEKPEKQEFKAKVFKFNGHQMWGTANVTVRVEENGFSVMVKSSLPVTLWTIYDADQTELDQGRVSELETFEFYVKELYLTPYVLYLNVIYMGLPNIIKVDMK